jgi:hypothetical protein
VDQFIRDENKFVLYETYSMSGRMTSSLFSCIDIDMSRVFSPARHSE